LWSCSPFPASCSFSCVSFFPVHSLEYVMLGMCLATLVLGIFGVRYVDAGWTFLHWCLVNLSSTLMQSTPLVSDTKPSPARNDYHNDVWGRYHLATAGNGWC
jgi:hypothetical protein